MKVQSLQSEMEAWREYSEIISPFTDFDIRLYGFHCHIRSTDLYHSFL